MSHTVTMSGIQAPGLGLERARLAAEMGKWETAVVLLRDRAGDGNADAEVLGLYGWCLAHAGGDLDTARDACRRAVDMQPYVAHQHARLGDVYRAAGLGRHAADCFHAALALDPTQTLARDGLVAVAIAPGWRSWLQRAARPRRESLPA
jgi:tetratricopeptide (TPR) repeat protein